MIMLLAVGAAVVPAATTFSCTPTCIWNGDGPAWSAEGSRLTASAHAIRREAAFDAFYPTMPLRLLKVLRTNVQARLTDSGLVYQ